MALAAGAAGRPSFASRRERHVLGQVASALHDLRCLQRPAPTARRLERRWALFCELPDVLRLAPQDLPHGQRPQPAATPPERLLQVVAADLAGFQQELRQRLQALPSEPHKTRPRPSCWLTCSAIARACAGIRSCAITAGA